MNDADEVTETAADSLRELLAHDTGALTQYLRQSFLVEAMMSLFHARRKAGLTQQQVAARMGTKQSVIARWEADLSGAISLRNYVDFAVACGMRPFDMTLTSLSALAPFAKEHLDKAITVEAYHDWLWSEPLSPDQGQSHLIF
jgi:transcriptional regulator with XRE-family HTH domain